MATWLIPREHGAYGQLGAPVLTAVVLGNARLAVWAVVAAIVAAFCSHESWLVLTGQRGTRAQRDDGPLARRVLGGLLAAAICFAAAGLSLMPTVDVAYLAIPALLWFVMSGMCISKREHTAPGEIVAAVALAAACIPVALAGGMSVAAGLAVWVTFGAGFTVATVAVRSVTSRIRRPDDRVSGYLAGGLAIGGLLFSEWLARSGTLPPLVARAPDFFFLNSIGLAFSKPDPSSLRRVGWGLMATSLVTVVMLYVALRPSASGPAF